MFQPYCMVFESDCPRILYNPCKLRVWHRYRLIWVILLLWPSPRLQGLIPSTHNYPYQPAKLPKISMCTSQENLRSSRRPVGPWHPKLCRNSHTFGCSKPILVGWTHISAGWTLIEAPVLMIESHFCWVNSRYLRVQTDSLTFWIAPMSKCLRSLVVTVPRRKSLVIDGSLVFRAVEPSIHPGVSRIWESTNHAIPARTGEF